MKVIAIKAAFFNGTRVRVGDEVDVPESLKGSWFVAADAVKAVKPTKRVTQPSTLSDLAKSPVTDSTNLA